MMETMVEESGSNQASLSTATDPLATSPNDPGSHSPSTSVQSPTTSTGVSIVHVTIPQAPTIQVQSVIQTPQQSVIQTAANVPSLQLQKGNVILVKPNSVIQTAAGNLQTLQVVDAGSDESMSNDDDQGVKKRREILARRPSYRKILNDLGGGEIAVSVSDEKGDSPTTSDSSQDNEGGGGTISLSGGAYQTGLLKGEYAEADVVDMDGRYRYVIPAGTIQIAASGSQGEVQGIQTLTMANATTSGAIVQYAQSQDGQFFVPAGVVVASNTGTPTIQSAQQMAEEAARKRELRLLKNREAARECRRKKKEYIKCLENRVAVLENQNKALIEELKSLKELYCQQKTE